MEIKGQIEDIIYQNEINSYTVCTIESGDSLITAVGYLPFINVGETVKLIGKFVQHQEYGEQFKIDTFEKLMPENLESLEKYLGSGAIKGVGPATAKKITNKFGEQTLHILRFDCLKLSKVSGISESKASEIGEEFNTKWELWQIVGFLEKFGISASNAKKVFDAFGKDAIQKIEQNPYILLDITYGINFKEIDKMAIELGINIDNDYRIESGIKYALSLIAVNGHVCAIKENLMQYVKSLLTVEEENIENSLINLKVKKQIIIEERGNENWVYLYPFFKAEKNICERIMELVDNKNSYKINDVGVGVLDDPNMCNVQQGCRGRQPLQLSPKQKQAIEDVIKHNVCIITGGPGTRENHNYKKHNRYI